MQKSTTVNGYKCSEQKKCAADASSCAEVGCAHVSTHKIQWEPRLPSPAGTRRGRRYCHVQWAEPGPHSTARKRLPSTCGLCAGRHRSKPWNNHFCAHLETSSIIPELCIFKSSCWSSAIFLLLLKKQEERTTKMLDTTNESQEIFMLPVLLSLRPEWIWRHYYIISQD